MPGKTHLSRLRPPTEGNDMPHLTIPRVITSLVVATLLAVLAMTAPAFASETETSTVPSNGARMTLTLTLSGTMVTSSVATIQLPSSWANRFCAYAFVNRVNRAPDLFGVRGNNPNNRQCDTNGDARLRWVIPGNYRMLCGDSITLWTSDPVTRYDKSHPALIGSNGC